MHILTIIYVTIVMVFLFGITIFVHELGHFLFARRYRLRIERFSIGFGPKLWSFSRDGIEYRISAIPFGGYVVLPQMSPLNEDEKKKFDPPLGEAKPWHKIVVAMAGAAFNLIFGFVVACLIWWVGKPVDSSELNMTIGYVVPNSPEHRAGLRPGDKILAINGQPVSDWSDVHQDVVFSRSQTVTVDFEHDGKRQPPAEFVPERSKLFGLRQLQADSKSTPVIDNTFAGSPADKAGLRKGDQVVAIDGIPVLSVGHMLDLIGERKDTPSEFTFLRDGKEIQLTITPRYDSASKSARIGASIRAQTAQITVYPDPWKQFKEVILSMANTVNALIHHKETGVGAKDLSGPPGILYMLYVHILMDIRLGLSFVVLLNINLALINLLPIPVLDGGHIMFAIFEAIRRKPLSYRFASVTQTAFAALLISFILYVSFNDFVRFVRIGIFKPRAEPSQPQFEQSHSTTVAPGATTSPATP